MLNLYLVPSTYTGLDRKGYDIIPSNYYQQEKNPANIYDNIGDWILFGRKRNCWSRLKDRRRGVAIVDNGDAGMTSRHIALSPTTQNKEEARGDKKKNKCIIYELDRQTADRVI
ncbi:hypothetical protein CEXT_273291 [Caerostris extrusa]|uniref:Uncharacterized protein n=1 Tax=Caerostris extrusa TaxID=172846 RepID=A0AAV4MEI9_CAEEX|nr:hypothetical protein CEXT_273291 [Caerostris extrusa]